MKKFGPYLAIIIAAVVSAGFIRGCKADRESTRPDANAYDVEIAPLTKDTVHLKGEVWYWHIRTQDWRRHPERDTAYVFDTGLTSYPVTIYLYSAIHDSSTKRKCSISDKPYTNQAQTRAAASWYRNRYGDAEIVHTGPGIIICDDINWNHD